MNNNEIYKYLVVAFPDDKNNHIAVIPAIWVKEESEDDAFCYWPKTKNGYKVNSYVQSQKEPDETWEVHRIRIIRRSRSYKSADSKATYYEKNSDVEPYSTDYRHYSSSSDDGYEHEPALKKRKGDKIPTPPVFSCSPTRTESPRMPLAVPFPQTPTHREPPRRKDKIPTPPAFPSNHRRIISGRNLVPLGHHATISPGTPSTSQGLPTSQQFQTCNCNIELKGLMDSILKELQSLKAEVKELRAENRVGEEQLEVEGFPISSVENLKKLDESLVSNDEFSKLAHFFGRIGGRDVNEVTRRILSSMMVNDVAVQLNWIGGYGKQSMKELKRVVLLICAAARQVPATRKVNQAAVEEVVKKWLRTALDRDGGRQNRKKNTEKKRIGGEEPPMP